MCRSPGKQSIHLTRCQGGEQQHHCHESKGTVLCLSGYRCLNLIRYLSTTIILIK